MLIKQFRIYRGDLKANPNVHYVFGDNSKREGYGGQAKEMRDEPNAIGIATKWAGSNAPSAFFSDDQFQEQSALILQDFVPVFDLLEEGKIVVWPSDGIGTGLSDVPNKSPLTWRFMLAIQEKMEIFGCSLK